MANPFASTVLDPENYGERVGPPALPFEDVGWRPARDIESNLPRLDVKALSNEFNAALAMRKLYQSLSCDGWKITNGKNREWRTEAPAYFENSPEVTLGCEIVTVDTTNPAAVNHYMK